MSKLKRGDKHPSKELVFYQYHHPFYKETNGEVWLTQEEYNKRVSSHSKGTAKYKKKYPLKVMTFNAVQRDKKKYNTNKKDLITSDFIEDLWWMQNGVCHWYNVEMNKESSEGKFSRNPLKVTIDRLDNSKGYEKDNIVLCCYAANCGRGNASIEAWELIINKIKTGLNG